ncbi:MAG: PhoH family protein, partial [Alphaproteobacteria bacterium]|nr:PhoH family protein [Alphaproteobacteria bacterium]
ALETLRGLDEVAIVTFGEKDVVRHPLVARIVGAYDARDRRRAARRKRADGETA